MGVGPTLSIGVGREVGVLLLLECLGGGVGPCLSAGVEEGVGDLLLLEWLGGGLGSPCQ